MAALMRLVVEKGERAQRREQLGAHFSHTSSSFSLLRLLFSQEELREEENRPFYLTDFCLVNTKFPLSAVRTFDCSKWLLLVNKVFAPKVQPRSWSHFLRGRRCSWHKSGLTKMFSISGHLVRTRCNIFLRTEIWPASTCHNKLQSDTFLPSFHLAH